MKQLLLAIIPLLIVASMSNVYASGPRLDYDERICKEGTAPSYLDCDNILRYIDGGEREIMRCAKGYLVA
jgi:hypothetical protein